jgi:hypothetical protein
MDDAISSVIVNSKGMTTQTMETMLEVLVKRSQEPDIGEETSKVVLHELVKRASSRPNSFRKHLVYRPRLHLHPHLRRRRYLPLILTADPII